MTQEQQPKNRDESEIRRLLGRIDAEYNSAMRAVRSFAYGSTQHRFITARMERMRVLQEIIADKVGEQEATRLVCQQLDKSSDQCNKSSEAKEDK